MIQFKKLYFKLLIPYITLGAIACLLIVLAILLPQRIQRIHSAEQELQQANAFISEARRLEDDAFQFQFKSTSHLEAEIARYKSQDQFLEATDNASEILTHLSETGMLPVEITSTIVTNINTLRSTFEQSIIVASALPTITPISLADSITDVNQRIVTTPSSRQVEELSNKMNAITATISHSVMEAGTILEKALDSAITSSYWATAILFAILLATLILALLTVNRKIVRGVQEMKETLTSLSDGHVPQKIDIHTEDEIAACSLAINNVIERIQTAATFAEKIGAGELQLEYDEHFKNDVLATSLQGMHHQLKQASEDNQKRNWVTTGLANFGNILRSNESDLRSVGQNIISNLVKYLKANQGQLFAIVDNNLELIATYAWGRTKHLSRTIEKGEGLAGQAWIENQTIFLKEIPHNYMRITSGLGDTYPSCILIVPLKLNDEVFGVVELGSFNTFQPHEIEFVEKLGELLASTLSGAKVNERTRQLLAESQHQAEELRAQEEEMRQNMEELTATQEEMARKDIEISGQINAINNSMATIEFTMDGYVTNANDRFLQLTGYRLDEIKGKHHSLFLDSEYAASDAYQKFWKDLNHGVAQTGEFVRYFKNRKKVWISASYTVVMNKHNEPLKVIKFAQDLTESKLRAADFEGQIQAIRKSNAVIEFDITGKILYANDLFLEAMGYKNISEVIDHHHRMFVNDIEANSTDYRKFWERLRQGEFFTGEFQRKKADGEKIWIYGSYNPILNTDGIPYKVVKYASVINKAEEQAKVTT